MSLARHLASSIPFLAGAVVLTLGACGSDGRGTSACETIEAARCRRAPACPSEFPDVDVDRCLAYYRDQCLHGLVSGASPSGSETNACVAAINESCAVAKAPQSHAACRFLGTVDAGADGAATDSGADAQAADAQAADAGPPDTGASSDAATALDAFTSGDAL